MGWDAGGLERLEQRLNAITSELARGFRLHPDRAPYPGIHAFEAEDAAIYFGRDDETRAVVERLDARRTQGGARLLLIIGASGSGKSSLLRAGVLPQIARRRREWIALPPIRPEKAPLETVAKAIAEHLGKPEDWRAWHERLGQPAAADDVDELLKDLRIGEARNATVLLPVDQFEEVFTVAIAARAHRPSCALLAATLDPARDLPLMVVATGRSDVLEGLDPGRRPRASDRDLSAAADAARAGAAAGRGTGRGRRHQCRKGPGRAHRARRRERRGAAAAGACALAALSPRRRRQEADARRIRGARRSAARPQPDPEFGAAGRRPGDRRLAADAGRSSPRCATPSCRISCASAWRTASASARRRAWRSCRRARCAWSVRWCRRGS